MALAVFNKIDEHIIIKYLINEKFFPCKKPLLDIFFSYKSLFKEFLRKDIIW